jgi:hypothetical protein
MVTNNTSPLNEAERQAEERTGELIREFHAHYRECMEAHPEHAGKQREIFEAWAIQKIAGLQLCVEHISEQFNLHVEGHELF